MDDNQLPAPFADENDVIAHLDQALSLDDILDGCLVVILCDDELRPFGMLMLGEVPPEVPPHVVAQRWVGQLADHLEDPPGVIFARARAGRSFVVDEDRAWHEAMLTVCRERGMPLHAAFVVTQYAVVPFPAPLTSVGA